MMTNPAIPAPAYTPPSAIPPAASPSTNATLTLQLYSSLRDGQPHWMRIPGERKFPLSGREFLVLLALASGLRRAANLEAPMRVPGGEFPSAKDLKEGIDEFRRRRRDVHMLAFANPESDEGSIRKVMNGLRKKLRDHPPYASLLPGRGYHLQILAENVFPEVPPEPAA